MQRTRSSNSSETSSRICPRMASTDPRICGLNHPFKCLLEMTYYPNLGQIGSCIPSSRTAGHPLHFLLSVGRVWFVHPPLVARAPMFVPRYLPSLLVLLPVEWRQLVYPPLVTLLRRLNQYYLPSLIRSPLTIQMQFMCPLEMPTSFPVNRNHTT